MLTESLTNFLVRLLGPILRPISRWLLSPERKRPTWHYEGFAVFILLMIVAALTSPRPWETPGDVAALKAFVITWISAAAVMGSFLHAKVGYRMSEAMAANDAPPVSCYEWSGRYWLGKEILWLIVFLLSGAYPAIVGNVVFILYPSWRQIHVQERKKLRGGK